MSSMHSSIMRMFCQNHEHKISIALPPQALRQSTATLVSGTRIQPDHTFKFDLAFTDHSGKWAIATLQVLDYSITEVPNSVCELQAPICAFEGPDNRSVLAHYSFTVDGVDYEYHVEFKATSDQNFTPIPLVKMIGSPRFRAGRIRYKLALDFATSFIQLYSTPWFDALLQYDEVFMFSSILESEPLRILHNPLISANRDVLDNDFNILGIRLLELAFDMHLKNSSYRKELPLGDDKTGHKLDIVAARQWSEEVEHEAGPEYAKAVKWCLKENNLDTETWEKEIWEHVAIPLYSVVAGSLAKIAVQSFPYFRAQSSPGSVPSSDTQRSI